MVRTATYALSCAQFPLPACCAQDLVAFRSERGAGSPRPRPGSAVPREPPRSQSGAHAGPTKLAALSPSPQPLSPSLHPCALAPLARRGCHNNRQECSNLYKAGKAKRARSPRPGPAPSAAARGQDARRSSPAGRRARRVDSQ